MKIAKLTKEITTLSLNYRAHNPALFYSEDGSSAFVLTVPIGPDLIASPSSPVDLSDHLAICLFTATVPSPYIHQL
jgi:hypothetical protein